MIYRILVTGSRNLKDYNVVGYELSKLIAHAKRLGHQDVVVVHGNCETGADHLAARFCEERGVPTDPHTAEWRRPDGSFDRTAGPKRNTVMVNSGANCGLSFWTGSAAGGTLDCTRKACKAGIRMIIVPIKDGQ